MSIVDEVKQRLDIVEVIGEYVSLQKTGKNFKGLCPFHTEDTPSFVVFPETQSWHCFGACSTGGDILTFIMRQENMDFPEALRFLAAKAGVELKPLSDAAKEQRNEAQRLYAINADAAQYYNDLLLRAPQAERARDYLKRRGINRETAVVFQLGFAPDQWHALETFLKSKGYEQEQIVQAGLAAENDEGNVYDRFRGRVIFPIRDVRGRTLGFGGRVLDDSQPKYLNTPTTPIFDKGSVLYGIDLAASSIRESGTAIIVEGYMDVVIPHQCGVDNVVACMGTALTEKQVQILKRMTDELIFALDPDEAGVRAVEKGVDVARKSLRHQTVPVPTATGLVEYKAKLDAQIRVLVLPEGLDPDELVLRDRSRWDRLVDNAVPVVGYFFQLVEKEVDLSTATGKREAVERLIPVIAAVDNVVERNHHLQHLAQLVHIDERELRPLLERSGRSQRGRASFRRPPEARRGPETTAGDLDALPARRDLSLEERCLALVLQYPTLLPRVMEVADVSEETFQDSRNRQIFSALGGFMEEEKAYDVQAFCDSLDNELGTHVESLLQRLQAEPSLSPDLVRGDVIKCATRFRKRHISQLIGELYFLQRDAQEEGARERVRELDEKIEQLRRTYLHIDQRFHAATFVGRSKRGSWF
ncbi:MAG: DNA primase [Chloroflexota bacterium]|nr:DNA primase [Chloroflexota bacterium]